MVLPILVPPAGEPWVATWPKPRPRSAPRRATKVVAAAVPDPALADPADEPAAARRRLVLHWRGILHLGAGRAQRHDLMAKRRAGVGDEGDLLRDCEQLLRVLLHRSRRGLLTKQRQGLLRITNSFLADTSKVRVTRADMPALSWLLAAMYWRGFRHPAALNCTPLHPPTGVLRWLMGFTVQQQVDQRRQVLDLLVREVGHVERRSRAVAGALVKRIKSHSALVVLLPELLG